MAYAGFDEGFLALPRSWGRRRARRRMAALIEAGQAVVIRDAAQRSRVPASAKKRASADTASMIALPLRVEGAA